MSCNYAEGLSPYANKGKCGLPERYDAADVVEEKVDRLAAMFREAEHVVVHTGAGISTAAGIPDFRGPRGVWTLEKRGLKPEMNVSWDEAQPTLTHMALVALQRAGRVQHVVTQNIDGLHLRSGLPRSHLSELHGNMFVHQCAFCRRQFVRASSVPTVGEKCLELACPAVRPGGRRCRGKLHDTILDWEGALPETDLELAELHSSAADLSLCLGTTLQIVPSGQLPTYGQRAGGRLAICNLQPTKHDRRADLLIHAYVDHVMSRLLQKLDIPLVQYDPALDPCRLASGRGEPTEWTLPTSSVKDTGLLRLVQLARRRVQQLRQKLKKERPIDQDPESKKPKLNGTPGHRGTQPNGDPADVKEEKVSEPNGSDLSRNDGVIAQQKSEEKPEVNGASEGVAVGGCAETSDVGVKVEHLEVPADEGNAVPKDVEATAESGKYVRDMSSEGAEMTTENGEGGDDNEVTGASSIDDMGRKQIM